MLLKQSYNNYDGDDTHSDANIKVVLSAKCSTIIFSASIVFHSLELFYYSSKAGTNFQPNIQQNSMLFHYITIFHPPTMMMMAQILRDYLCLTTSFRISTILLCSFVLIEQKCFLVYNARNIIIIFVRIYRMEYYSNNYYAKNISENCSPYPSLLLILLNLNNNEI